MKLWKFLTTDIRELNWGKTEEATKTGAEAAKAVFELAKTLQEKGSKAQNLQPYVVQISSLLDVLNDPLAQIAGSLIPFAPIAITVIKLIAEVTQKEPSIEQCVALVSQVAYLESFRSILKADQPLLEQIGKAPVSDSVATQIRKLGDLELEDREARKAILYFHESQLAVVFNEVLQQRLQQAGLSETEAKSLTERVARTTNEYLPDALVEAGDAAKRLVEWYCLGGAEQLERYLSIDEYLEKEIRSKPNEIVFDETELGITFRDLYVPLKAALLDSNGNEIQEAEPVVLEEWIRTMLQDPAKQKQVLFIQGEAGRGKSVFCRMFADRVARELHPTFTPIVVRLRHLLKLENSLTQTLSNYLENWDFVISDQGWLTDKRTRFLFLLDGFDELLLEGRASGGLKEFLQQIEGFQRNSEHRFLITGRPLALQGIERVISQTDCLERVELQAMNNSIQQAWLNKWKVKVGEAETTELEQFLSACPEDIQEKLAREPLLLYLLARMHREKRLNAQMFIETKGIQAKILIYNEAVTWVLEKQRQNENFRLTGLETEDLRRCLTEAALCVVQSGNESAKVATLQTRLRGSSNPVATLIQKAKQETDTTDERVLNNLLTAFYVKPASGDRGGSVEFAHKSFGEFLFAERLKEALEDWSKLGDRRRGGFLVEDKVMNQEIYDLLGYGGLSPEVVEYLMALLITSDEMETNRWIQLFERLNSFYERWCEGAFIDAQPENLPLEKMLLFKEQLPERESPLGLRQVDVFTGLNSLILLLELHRYAQTKDDLREQVIFYPSGRVTESEHYSSRLLKVIHYADCVALKTFTATIGYFLNSADLNSADLNRANLNRANLANANLTSANLNSANLYRADLNRANLTNANLTSADLNIVYLTNANLISADLTSANLNSANLTSANLNSADLYSARLISANLYSADLTNADLNSANLTNANLTNANLTNTYLTRAYLTNANLNSADLTNADLNSTDLTNADLYSTNLTNANLTNANLNSANLNSANLSGANLSGANLENISWDEATRWEGVQGLKTSINLPEALKQQLGFS
jgi:uncharacterized protein YjbI with pentapeptide repeats